MSEKGFWGVVNTRRSALYIRAGRSKVLVNLTSVPKGTRLWVTGGEDGWYGVKHRGATGFVRAEYILPLDTPLDE